MANEKTPVVWDDDAKKHRPLGSGEKMGGLSASSMISSDSGNLLQQGSDGLMLVTGSSLADPRADNLLEESGSGKLQVTSDRVVEWLEGHPQAAAAIADAVKVVSGDEGNVIVQGSDKGAFLSKATINSAVASMTPEQLAALTNSLLKAGGGLNVDPSTGRLVVDFASMDPAIMRNVVLSMVQSGGGIGVDQNGQLYVDFDSMPTDKFEAMMKSLKMLIPLDAGMTLFVNGATGTDVVPEGTDRRTVPFKTIQAAVDYVTSTYAVGRWVVDIRVHPGTYSAPVLRLPDYSRTIGYITISAVDASNVPVLVNESPIQSSVACTGGLWIINGLSVRNNVSDNGSSVPEYPNGIAASGTAELRLYHTSMYMSYAGAAPSGHTVTLRTVLATSGGSVTFYPTPNGPSSVELYKGNANSAFMFNVETNSNIWLHASNAEPSGDMYKLFMSGEVSYTFMVNGGNFAFSGGELNKMSFAIPSGASLTGSQPYSVRNGGSMRIPSSSPIVGTYTGEGIVESATYSWFIDS